MKQYECVGCGYIYDEKKGEFALGIRPGTLFEDLPEEWLCPVCGASKAQFSPLPG